MTALSPLLPALSRQGRFFLLTLTEDRIGLFEGTASTLEPVDLGGRDLAAWTTMPPLHAPQPPAFLADRDSLGARTAFHGVDSAGDHRRSRALQHFRGTERALREVLGEDRPPLVLGGVRPLQALYRAVSTYPHLLERGIDGYPELLGAGELHRRAWALAGRAAVDERAGTRSSRRRSTSGPRLPTSDCECDELVAISR